MISTPNSHVGNLPAVGINAISIFRPPWVLSNDWFDSIPRKFVKHTGILNRHVSNRDEVELAVEATNKLISETSCDLGDCAGIVFTSPSYVPINVAREFMDEDQLEKEQLDAAANLFAQRMQIRPRVVIADNTYCAGYASALSIVRNTVNPLIKLQKNEFVLVLTSSRISRITDYSCSQSSALFGDLATATIISRLDSDKYPARFELVAVNVEEKAMNRSFFQFRLQHNVLAPTQEGGKRFHKDRVVFLLDGMGIADAAPRAMANASSELLSETRWRHEDIDYIVPHQAGSAIVRLAEMKLRESGFTCRVINDMTRDVGNVSSGSIPFTLHEKWAQLDGNILCPVASVGPPGKPAVMQGCIALRSTTSHSTV